MAGSIAVLILDERALLREALRLLVATQRDLSVVGEAGDGARGSALCAAHPDAIAVTSPALATVAPSARVVVMPVQSSAALFAAVRAAARGELVPAPSAAELALLTARERQVFGLLVRGHGNVAIGRQLGISAKTVDTHRQKVLRKIGVHSIVDLVRFAARHSLPLD